VPHGALQRRREHGHHFELDVDATADPGAGPAGLVDDIELRSRVGDCAPTCSDAECGCARRHRARCHTVRVHTAKRASRPS
jgi:hypothetical protein